MNPEGIVSSHYEKVVSDWEARGVNVLYKHFGEMEREQANDIAFEIEGVLKSEGEKKGVIKRVFSTLIEALQNVRIHGERDDEGRQWSYVVIGVDQDKYVIRTANLSFSQLETLITEKIEKVNEFEEGALKEHYMEILSNGQLSSKGGAGLGFITIAMKSKNKIGFQFDEIGDGIQLFSMDSFVTSLKNGSV